MVHDKENVSVTYIAQVSCKCNNVEILKLCNVTNPQNYIKLCTGVETFKHLVSLGASVTWKLLDKAIIHSHVDIVKYICEHYPQVITDEIIIRAFGDNNREIVECIVKTVDVSHLAKHIQLHDIRYRYIPSLPNKFMAACVTEDLETVKEMYPLYQYDMLYLFPNASFELKRILYRGHYDGDDIDFLIYTGYSNLNKILEKPLCDLRLVKHLVKMGITWNKNIKVAPRIERYLDTV